MTVSEFNKCIDDYSDSVYRFILKNCKDENIAKDIVQDSFEKFWLKKNDILKGKEKSYLFTVAYHTFIDYKRKEKEIKKLNEIEEKNYCDTNQYNDIQEQLHKALDLLPEIQKSVLLLRDYEGYSYQEIAEITLLNESQVKVYIFRARKFLQQYIGSIEQLL